MRTPRSRAQILYSLTREANQRGASVIIEPGSKGWELRGPTIIGGFSRPEEGIEPHRRSVLSTAVEIARPMSGLNRARKSDGIGKVDCSRRQ